jgi:hypothetical protein
VSKLIGSMGRRSRQLRQAVASYFLQGTIVVLYSQSLQKDTFNANGVVKSVDFVLGFRRAPQTEIASGLCDRDGRGFI